SLEAGDEAVGNSLIMRNMDVTGDIRNDDIYRNLYVDITDTTITGAMVSTTIETWNAMWTVEALEQSAAYASALEEQASWADEIPNATYDAEYPYADAEIDLEMVSEYLTQADYADCNGIYLTLNEGAVWNVTGDSQLVSLTVAEGAVINAEGCEIYVNCSDYFDVTTGQQVESLEAGEYENVVILVVAGDASGELDFNDGADVSASDSPTTVLKGAALLDSTYNGEVLDVLVQDGVIIAVGEDLEGDEVIDLTGYTLMPGLIDAHVHVAGSDYNLELLATWCSQGVTSVRELGMLSTLGEDEYYDLVQEANADSANATLVTTGKYLDVAGGYGMGPTGNMGVEITNAEEAVAEVEHKVALGYPQVKIGINSDKNRMTAEEISAIIEAAHENGMTVSAHINYVSYLEELVALGIDESAHTPSDEMSGELIDAMVEAGVAMNTSGAEDVLDVKVANLAAFYEAGGLVTVGTDLMRNYDTAAASLIEEMRVLIEAGLSVQEVIACTTHNNAQVLGLATGDIAEGLEADLIAVEGDVDEALDALEDVDFVMNNGVVIIGG
ncbi:MAG: amidohydrolase family protein, partial [Oscillospiraceae bacterium]|nr:amidohydrolase family protein [Oscillospiraceae bacterium]